jgi:hypothetical protein
VIEDLQRIDSVSEELLWKILDSQAELKHAPHHARIHPALTRPLGRYQIALRAVARRRYPPFRSVSARGHRLARDADATGIAEGRRQSAFCRRNSKLPYRTGHLPGRLRWRGFWRQRRGDDPSLKLPESVTAEALYLTVQATGNFQKQAIIPLVTGEQFKAAMEKAQQAKTGYTPPTMAK